MERDFQILSYPPCEPSEGACQALVSKRNTFTRLDTVKTFA